MAESFGEQLCEIFAGLEILSLGDDSQLKVRKEAVHNITKIGKVVSKDFFNEKLLEFYLRYTSTYASPLTAPPPYSSAQATPASDSHANLLHKP